MAINDVLPLKAARHDATDNVKWFWGHQGPNFDGFNYIRYAASPYAAGISDSASLTFSGLAKFGWAPFAVCNAWQRSRTQNLGRMGEISGQILKYS